MAAAVHSTSSPVSRPVIVGLAQRHGAEHQGAVRHRLVAGRADMALEPGDRMGDQLGRGGGGGQEKLPKCGAAPSYHARIWF